MLKKYAVKIHIMFEEMNTVNTKYEHKVTLKNTKLIVEVRKCSSADNGS